MKQIDHKWDAKLYNDKHSFVYDYGVALIDLLNPKPNERILDLGCGSGELTYKINQQAHTTIGIDQSSEMIDRARLQFPLTEFSLGDASNFNFEQSFDAIFSNAALHWVTNYKSVIRCMYNNLNKGGRIVVEFGGKDNVKTIIDALQKSLLKREYVEQAKVAPWYFPSIGQYTSELESEGFTVSYAQWYERPTELEDKENGIKDWLAMFSSPFFKGVESSDKTLIMSEVQESLKPQLFRNGKWYADYKRIRIEAYR